MTMILRVVRRKAEVLDACIPRVNLRGGSRVNKSYLIRRCRRFDIYRLEPTSEEVDRHCSVEAQEWIDRVHEALLFMGLCGEEPYPYIDWS
jgi:hypothetical protein